MYEPAHMRFDHARGPIYAWFTERGLCAMRLPRSDEHAPRIPVLHSGANDQRVWAMNAALEAFFAGIRQDFACIPLDLSSGTPFQQAVWQGARETPWGSCATYGGLARRIGKAQAARAVGQALGRNPVPIVVPCHRFIAANGALTGFGSGIEWKRELLELEGSLGG